MCCLKIDIKHKNAFFSESGHWTSAKLIIRLNTQAGISTDSLYNVFFPLFFTHFLVLSPNLSHTHWHIKEYIICKGQENTSVKTNESNLQQAYKGLKYHTERIIGHSMLSFSQNSLPLAPRKILQKETRGIMKVVQPPWTERCYTGVGWKMMTKSCCSKSKNMKAHLVLTAHPQQRQPISTTECIHTYYENTDRQQNNVNSNVEARLLLFQNRFGCNMNLHNFVSSIHRHLHR